LETIAADASFRRRLPVNEKDSRNHNKQSKGQQAHPKCGESFHDYRLPSQTALNLSMAGQQAGRVPHGAHISLEKYSAGKPAYTLSNTADNGFESHRLHQITTACPELK
jgi:hypothetical protein